MWWQYLLVFIGALLFDIVPFPFLPAFTIMLFLQIVFHLDVWWVIAIGLIGSVLGRYILILYIPHLSNKYLNVSKNRDIEFIGATLNQNKWKGQMVILAYSLLPLPTTPLFLAAGISKIKARYIIPWFLIGKFVSDTVALFAGAYAVENTESIIENAISWQSIASLVFSVVLLFCLFFIDWRTLIQKKKFVLNFRILK